jgi:hypothetical protein
MTMPEPQSLTLANSFEHEWPGVNLIVFPSVYM